MITALFVLARIVANPVSNVFQKQLVHRDVHPLAVIGATHALLALALSPLLPAATRAGGGSAFWGNLAVAALLAVAGNVLLVHALRGGELSVLGPINAYKPVVALALGVVLIGEVPTPAGLLGILLIVAGSFLVVPRGSGRSGLGALLREPSVRLRFGALALSATEAIFLKRALLASSPLATFVLWAALGVPVAAVATMALLRGRTRGELSRAGRQWPTLLRLAAATGVMQGATLFTFGALQVGYSLAVFQLSALLSVLLGYRYFAERDVGRRLAGAAVMVAGAALIVALGSR